MKRCYHANESWRLALLEYLTTPLDSNIPSPSELNGRQFSGLLPDLRCNSLPDSTSEALIDRHKKQLDHGICLKVLLFHTMIILVNVGELVLCRKGKIEVTSLLMIEAYLFPEIEWISDQPTPTTLCTVIVTFHIVPMIVQ